MNKIAVIYFSHDGITSIYTGVGTSSRDICYSMVNVIDKFKKIGVNIDFYPGTIRYNSEFHGYSENIKKEIQDIIKKINTEIIEVENGSDGLLSYGNVTYWETASKNAAKEIDRLAKKYSKIIAITSDTPFANVSSYINSKNVLTVWVPRSTAKIHSTFKLRNEDGTMEEFTLNRINWEQKAINFANENRNSYVAYIGDFVKEHLIKYYNAKAKKLIAMTIGLYYPRLDTYKKSQKEIKKYLESKNIPTNKDLLVSFSRLEKYKGLDLVIQLGGVLESKYDIQTIILSVPYSMSDPYIEELNIMKERFNKNALIIFGHDFITPHYLMQWGKTKIVAVLSRQEPTGLVPSEFRYYKNYNAQLLVSNKDGLPERVTNGVDGFICDIDNDKSIKDSADKIINLSKKDKKMISNNGYETVTTKYNLVNNIFNMLQKLITK